MLGIGFARLQLWWVSLSVMPSGIWPGTPVGATDAEGSRYPLPPHSQGKGMDLSLPRHLWDPHNVRAVAPWLMPAKVPKVSRAEGLGGTSLCAGGCRGDGANPASMGKARGSQRRCSRSSLIRAEQSALGAGLAGGSTRMAPASGAPIVAQAFAWELPCFREERRSLGGSSRHACHGTGSTLAAWPAVDPAA